MALQGSLDAFDLADVLRLLGSTAKTGRLEVLTPRGPGVVILEEGKVVAVSAPGARPETGPVLAAVHLLRHRRGEFRFEPLESLESVAGITGPLCVDDLLGEAAGLLETWKEVEVVVPSLAAEVWLAPELPGEEVTVPAELWRLVVASAGGASVGGVAEALGLTEFDACRLVRDATHLGLVLVDPEPATRPEVASTAGTWAAPRGGTSRALPAEAPPAPVIPLFPPPEEPEDASAPPGEGLEASVDGLGVGDDRFGLGPGPGAGFTDGREDEPEEDHDRHDGWAAIPSSVPSASMPADDHPRAGTGGSLGIDIPGLPSLSPSWESSFTGPDDEDQGEEILLGQLTPQAARAIAAAARATSEAERDAAIDAAIAANDEPLDRRALLRFLSSVRQ